jgi:hypothetical protein
MTDRFAYKAQYRLTVGMKDHSFPSVIVHALEFDIPPGRLGHAIEDFAIFIRHHFVNGIVREAPYPLPYAPGLKSMAKGWGTIREFQN